MAVVLSKKEKSKATVKEAAEEEQTGGGLEASLMGTIQSALGPLLQQQSKQIAASISDAIAAGMSLAVQMKPATAAMTVQHGSSGTVVSEDANQEVLGYYPATKPLCNVGVQASHTINLGNYNNLKIGVTVNIPCEYKDLEATYQLAQEWVNGKMEALQEGVQSELGG